MRFLGTNGITIQVAGLDGAAVLAGLVFRVAAPILVNLSSPDAAGLKQSTT